MPTKKKRNQKRTGKGKNRNQQIILDPKEQFVIYKKEMMVSKWMREKLYWYKTLETWNHLMKRLKEVREDWG